MGIRKSSPANKFKGKPSKQQRLLLVQHRIYLMKEVFSTLARDHPDEQKAALVKNIEEFFLAGFPIARNHPRKMPVRV